MSVSEPRYGAIGGGILANSNTECSCVPASMPIRCAQVRNDLIASRRACRVRPPQLAPLPIQRRRRGRSPADQPGAAPYRGRGCPTCPVLHAVGFDVTRSSKMRSLRPAASTPSPSSIMTVAAVLLTRPGRCSPSVRIAGVHQLDDDISVGGCRARPTYAQLALLKRTAIPSRPRPEMSPAVLYEGFQRYVGHAARHFPRRRPRGSRMTDHLAGILLVLDALRDDGAQAHRGNGFVHLSGSTITRTSTHLNGVHYPAPPNTRAGDLSSSFSEAFHVGDQASLTGAGRRGHGISPPERAASAWTAPRILWCASMALHGLRETAVRSAVPRGPTALPRRYREPARLAGWDQPSSEAMTPEKGEPPPAVVQHVLAVRGMRCFLRYFMPLMSRCRSWMPVSSSITMHPLPGRAGSRTSAREHLLDTHPGCGVGHGFSPRNARGRSRG